jgi:hypothetical protein
MAAALVTVLPTFIGAAPDSGQACSSLIIQTGTDNYVIGEPVNITVIFAPLLPGCVEPMIAHEYVVQIQVLNASNQTLYSSTNVTAAALTIHKTWTPTTPGDYLIKASSWFSSLGNDFMTKQMETSTTIHVQDPVRYTMPRLELGVIGLVAILAVGVALLKRAREKSSPTAI